MDGRPLVIGPLNRGWPADTPVPAGMGQPRFGFGIGRYLRPLARYGWGRAMCAASLILCETPGYAREVQAAYPRARVLLTPVIVDPPPEDRPRVRWTGQGPFRLLFVANLFPGKNARVFCEVVGELRRRGVDAHGTVIGDGTEWALVQELIATRGLGEHIRMLGKIPNAEVFGHLRASHILVSTSIGEAYGRGIAEAMAVGTPPTCHRSGGPAEFITNGADGLLIGELTAAAFADQIVPLAAEPALWNELATGAARTAADWRSDVVLGTLEQALFGLCRETTVP